MRRMRRKGIVRGKRESADDGGTTAGTAFAPGSLRVRAVEPHDVPVVYAFIKELARFEGLSDGVTAKEADIGDALFGSGFLRSAIAWVETEIRSGPESYAAGEVPAGFILYYRNFSTFRGKAGLYVEDVFVDERFRGQGIAHALFDAVAEDARRTGAFCLQWAVLGWNERAKSFYRSIGGSRLEEWELWRSEIVAGGD